MSIPTMTTTVEVGRNRSVFSIELDKRCIHCGDIMTPNVITTSSVLDPQTPIFAVLSRCSCCGQFIANAYYTTDKHERCYARTGDLVFQTDRVPYSYSVKVDYDMPDEIESISPSFKVIYQQSQMAEAYKMDQIAGVGYRKAIEFLVKDYLINFKQQDQEFISKLFLGKAIEQIDHDQIKTLAKAATWIGNDETHYTRRWEDKNISDMKQFIRAISFYISTEYALSEAAEMNASNESNVSK